MKFTKDYLEGIQNVDYYINNEEIQQILQNQKLGELIEKRIKHYQKLGVDEWNEFDTHGWIVEELQKLLRGVRNEKL